MVRRHDGPLAGRELNTNEKLLVLLTRTLCFVIVATTVSMAVYGPERVPESARTLLYDFVKYLTGALVGVIVTKAATK
jgi:hypothetical protein